MKSHYKSYKEALLIVSKSLWKTGYCASGRKCWCRIVVPKTRVVYGENKEQFIIISSGCVDKEIAKIIVNNHNKSIK